MSGNKALIVGGGIGGLTAALCLHEFGLNVTVLEKANVVSEVGAGIQISPNGMKVFQALGLEKAMLEKGFQPEYLQMKSGRTSRSVFSVPIKNITANRYGAPYINIYRPDLIGILQNALLARCPNSILTNANVSAYENTKTGVTATTTDDRVFEGDILIGADGIHSVIRSQMIGPDPATFTGNVAWRAVVPVEKLGKLAPPPSATVWTGPGSHAVTYLLRDGDLANFVGVVETDAWKNEAWTERADRTEALEAFKGWAPEITKLIEQADEHYKWALFDRPEFTSWSESHTTLLGDACHPTLPFMAQGATMAIEDAWALARALKEKTSISAALANYETVRKPRTTTLQNRARANMKIYHQRTTFGQLKTYGPMWLAARFAPQFILAQLDKVYKYDVTAKNE